MSTRITGSLLLLIGLVISFNAVAFTQDPQPQQPTPATQPTQMDLSGTYTGTFNCEAAGLMGETTLTITGNQFTTSDGKTGRIVASRSGGYTAVALQLGEPTATTPTQIISMRARKYGSRLTLMAVPESAMKCSFAPARAAARRNQRTPSATGTTVAAPTTPTEPTTITPVPEQTPMPSPSPSPSPEPEPSPEPNPSPEPRPSPAPTTMPTPAPTPTGSPSPTPSPTPSPSPARG